VLKTLLDRKLIAEAGRKKVVGQPILYKTTKEFLVQFGLKDLKELPTLKEFEELGRMEIAEPEPPDAAAQEFASNAGEANEPEPVNSDVQSAESQSVAEEPSSEAEQGGIEAKVENA
jgi:segregation and condensation protein B